MNGISQDKLNRGLKMHLNCHIIHREQWLWIKTGLYFKKIFWRTEKTALNFTDMNIFVYSMTFSPFIWKSGSVGPQTTFEIIWQCLWKAWLYWIVKGLQNGFIFLIQPYGVSIRPNDSHKEAAHNIMSLLPWLTVNQTL